MGPERKPELGSDKPAEARRQEREATRLTARRLAEEARHLVAAARALAYGSPWEFSVTCPRGHDAVQAAFDRATLAQALRDGSALALHCPACGCRWAATAQQRDTLDWALRNTP